MGLTWGCLIDSNLYTCRRVSDGGAVTSWMRRHDHNIFLNATNLVICGALAGVVVAAGVFPAAAMSGLAAKAGGETFAGLPSELKQVSAPQLTRIFASDNRTQIAVMYDEFRADLPLKDISINMQHAIVAAEDHEFFHHNGVDLKGVARATPLMSTPLWWKNSRSSAATIALRMFGEMSLSGTSLRNSS